MKWNKLGKKATKQILILRYTVSRLRKCFVFLPSSDINMTFFLVYIRECIKHGSSLQDKQDVKFLLTQSSYSHKK